jgi:hypothetical protein
VRNQEELERVKKDRDILHTINRRRLNWIGLILSTEGRTEVRGRRKKM